MSPGRELYRAVFAVDDVLCVGHLSFESGHDVTAIGLRTSDMGEQNGAFSLARKAATVAP